MTAFIDILCRALSLLIAIFLAIMVLLVFGNVVLRYGFNSGITVSEEIARWLFVWLTFLGAVVAVKERAHLGTDMLVSRLPVAGKKFCLIVGHLLMLFICWLIFAGSLSQVQINWSVAAPVTGISSAILYASGLVCAGAIALLVLCDLWRAVSGQLTESELITVKESEESGEFDALQARLSKEDARANTAKGDES